MKKIIIIFIILISTTGCMNRLDLNNLLLPISMGVDYVDEEYNLYLQIVDPSLLSKVENQSITGEPIIILKGSGKTLQEASLELQAKQKKTISEVFIRSIIIQNSFMEKEKEIFDFLNNLLQAPRFASLANIFFTEESIEDIFLIKSVSQESPYYSIINDINLSRLDLTIFPRDLVFTLKNLYESTTIYIVSIKIEKEIVLDSNNEKKEVNILDINGAYFFDDNSKYIFIELKNLVGLKWFFCAQNVPFTLSIEEKTVLGDVYSIHVARKKDKVVLDAKVSIYNNIGKIENKIIEKKVVDLIYQELMFTLKSGLEKDINIFNFNQKNVLPNDLENIEIEINLTITNRNLFF